MTSVVNPAPFWPFVDQPGQGAIAQHVRYFIPMPDGVQALHGHIVGVVVAFSHLAGPADKGRVQVILHLLGLLVQQLLGHLFPGETQVAGHGHQSQTDNAAGRQDQRTFIVIIAGHLQEGFDGLLGHIAGCEEVGQCRPA
jgi:hypothetical protein